MRMLKNILLPVALMLMPSAVFAQAAPAVATPAVSASVAAPAADAAAKSAEAKSATPKSTDGSLPGYTPMAPTDGVGMPIAEGVDFQEQYTENGQ